MLGAGSACSHMAHVVIRSWSRLVRQPERLGIEALLDAEAENPNARALNYVSMIGGSEDALILRKGSHLVIHNEERVTRQMIDELAPVFVNYISWDKDQIHAEVTHILTILADRHRVRL